MKALTLTTLVLLAITASPVSANLVANSSFEAPITYDGAPFVGSWEGFNGGAGSSSANSLLNPRTGSQSLQLGITNTINTFAGAFQDIPALTPGTEYTFSGWHMTPSTPFDVGVEYRIEWRNSGTATEVARTPNQTTAPTASYSLFSLTAAAPVGADTARIVYAIQSFGGGATHNGLAFIDDISFVAIPEPSSMALLGLGGLALLALRRRQS